MFERFDQPARDVVVRAQEEARSLRHHAISLEHLFLGLLGDESLSGPLGEIVGHDQAATKLKVIEMLGEGTSDAPSTMPFTSAAKQLLENTLRQSLRLGSDHIGPGHMALAMFSQEMGKSTAALFALLGMSRSASRAKVLKILEISSEVVQEKVTVQVMKAIRMISPRSGVRFRDPPTTDEIEVFDLISRGASVADVSERMSMTVDEVLELAASALTKVGFRGGTNPSSLGHTERVERALSFAREEASENLELMDVEHLLLALTREKGSVAEQALTALGVTDEALRDVISQMKELLDDEDADEA